MTDSNLGRIDPKTDMRGESKVVERVGVVYWYDKDGIGELVVDTIADLGYEVTYFRSDAHVPVDVDLVFAYGPFRSVVPLANQLKDLAPTERPLLVFWLTEPLPNPVLPDRVVRAVATLRSAGERRAYKKTDDGQWTVKTGWHWLTKRGHRFRYIGDLKWLENEGVLSALVVSSPILATYLSDLSLSPTQIFMGCHPRYGANLGLDRDIPVLWLGKKATRRREKLLDFVRRELKLRGIELLVVDGVENPYVFGNERTVLLNRTRIVLNLLRAPYDNNSLRFCLAAPNGALIVSEPVLPHTPFKPGVHLIEATVEELPDTIAYYLDHEEECSPIIAKAFELATREFTMRRGIRKVMATLDGT